MLSKKLNNKGYMLVEIIIASVLAFSVAYYLLNLTYDFKDKNEDVYFSTATLSDKINITKNIMNDLEGKEVKIISSKNDNNSSYVILEVDTINNLKKIYIDKAKKTITYGKLKGDENSNFDVSDNSYYQKTIDNFLEFGNISIESSSNYIYIQIPISNIYSDNTYDIKLLIKGGGTPSNSLPATNKIGDLYNDGSSINTVHIGGDESNPEVKLNATQGIMLDNNGDYRYYGKNPNNYVTFNDETWRIIGSFNDVDDGTGKKETRLKIIRNGSIGSYSFDSYPAGSNSGTGITDWGESDLKSELNNLYYNSKSGTCYNGLNNASTTCDFTSIGLDSIARNMITDAIYYSGSSEISSIYVNLLYDDERNTTEDIATSKIAIMYASDYGYATDLSLCIDKLNDYSSSNCKNNNWLFNNKNESIMTPRGIYSHLWEVSSSGEVVNTRVAAYPREIRPVVYLKSNIKITGGTGTSSDPYKLSI